MSQSSALRASRLDKQLQLIIAGTQPLTTGNKPRFIEAICAAPDPAGCVSGVINSKAGLSSIQECMRLDLSLPFLNGDATALLHSLEPLSDISGGKFIQPVILAIAEPAIFWNSFLDAFLNGQLQAAAQLSFAWLLLQLVQLPPGSATEQRDAANNANLMDRLSKSTDADIRVRAMKINEVLRPSPTTASDTSAGPGGRHDNDFSDFRQVTILPTSNELICQERPFLRLASYLSDPDTIADRFTMHIDNQYRLLREDMVYEMRDEMQKKGKPRGLVVNGLRVIGVYHSDGRRMFKWGLKMECLQDLPFFKNSNVKQRKNILKDNRNLVKHQSMGSLSVDNKILAFPTINRVEDLLVREPKEGKPVLVLQFEDAVTTSRVLLALSGANPSQVKLTQINTAVFAYDPVLTALKEKRFSQFDELVRWDGADQPCEPPHVPGSIVRSVQQHPDQDMRSLLDVTGSTPIHLDRAQSQSLLAGLTQRVSIIQGPPGTGKSFIGALLAKIIHDHTEQKILVVCYTNHALDQFLEDLMKIGIPRSKMVRLGKANPATEDISLHNVSKAVNTKRSQSAWNELNYLKGASGNLSATLEQAFSEYLSTGSQPEDVLEHLEFAHPEFFDAFQVPQSVDGLAVVGKGGKTVLSKDVFQQWLKGYDAGVMRNAPNVKAAPQVWNMAKEARQKQAAAWREEIVNDLAQHISKTGSDYNSSVHKLDGAFTENQVAALSQARIIGCTTTAAAKYREIVAAALPDVLLVEEAGEILESHILTAIGPATKQLIMIGDHKQLRPKVNHYLLTVEKGNGYDLNRSLFERLVLAGYPHQTLIAQHRMRPEISNFIRHLTYPDLVDAPKTQGRPNLRGVTDNVVFIDHSHPEGDDSELQERNSDPSSKASKQNTFEVEMVLKILRYLSQQGYGTENIVILTPYLGQLRALRDALRKYGASDPILNDLDSSELVRAGLMTQSAADAAKRPIRLATIDNYQGEESDIVIASLTRSNTSGDIGFMSSPERLNVLLSRARNSMILIGNSKTFKKSRKGGEIWSQLFGLLTEGHHMYPGLPVKCERHPDRTAVLRKPAEFDELSVDGGCMEPCGTMLNCGVHQCPSKCHITSDHSKMACLATLQDKCPKQLHKQQWLCSKGRPVVCHKCEREEKLAEKRQREDFERLVKREEAERAHAKEMDALNEQLRQQRETERDKQDEEDRRNARLRKKKDLDDLAATAAHRRAHQSTQSSGTSIPSPPQTPDSQSTRAPGPSSSSQPSAARSAPVPPSSYQHSPQPQQQSAPSKAKAIWEHAKRINGDVNSAIDELMELSALEEVKLQVLQIKDKVDVATRQRASLKSERFHVSMLGNPGTGKTTVARIYSKFLVSVDIISGAEFFETTGSRLANEGVPKIEATLQKMVQAGGGVVFVDEAYQLTNGNSTGGAQVLDFLLAEIENLVGKVVFIFAGYNKEMETFFEHSPGLQSRVPYTLQFKDYDDDTLLHMLASRIHKVYQGRMQVETPVGDKPGIWGLYGRIAVLRIGRGRGTKSFANARTLDNMFARIRERQAGRIAQERMNGQSPNDFLMVKEDIIGPAPRTVMAQSPAWKKLQGMIGLTAIKDSVKTLFDTTVMNYELELAEKKIREVSLNRVFIGSPGTGKTTVAKLYGQILSELNLLSNGHEVILKNPSDFIGNVIGASESQTKAILASTVGKVLVIDEAYMLYGGTQGGNTDSFKRAVIDTLVAEVQSVPGEDRCVLLLGYKAEMMAMFQNSNPGLTRRFALEDAFNFLDYTEAELLQALEWKMQSQDLTATDHAKRVAMDVLNRLRNRPNFGNIGEVENVLSKAKINFQRRQSTLDPSLRSIHAPFEPEDFDPDFNRIANAEGNLKSLFAGVVGSGAIMQKLAAWQRMVKSMQARGQDPRTSIPTNFLFKGPPGTGKTTTARKMGQVYYDMGFLSSVEVIECSASDLVGQYVGQTGPKTTQLMEKALGKVLFIDEAYRLAEGHFAKEAMDEIVNLLTQEKFRGKLIVILAGYDADMNALMSVNSGLSSRFPEEIVFHHIPTAQCLQILKHKLGEQHVVVTELDDPTSPVYTKMTSAVDLLSTLPSWGNARDMDSLANQMVVAAYADSGNVTLSNGDIILPGQDALLRVQDMINTRRDRASNLPKTSSRHHNGVPPPSPMTPPSASTSNAETNTTSASGASAGKTAASRSPSPSPSPSRTSGAANPTRDAGVDDATWAQLQADKEAMVALEKHKREEIERLAREAEERIAQAKRDALMAQMKLALEREAKEQARLRELARIAELKAREEAERLRKAREQEERRKQQELQIQQKLRTIGRCVQGFQWIKQAHGYRCAGGSHFVSDAALGV